jgi:hypothetical protein
VGVSYEGMSQVVYPTRIEVMRAEADRRVLVEDGRQPAAAPDGLGFAFLRPSREGTAMLVCSPFDAEERVLIPTGPFRDISSPRYAPRVTISPSWHRRFRTVVPRPTRSARR